MKIRVSLFFVFVRPTVEMNMVMKWGKRMKQAVVNVLDKGQVLSIGALALVGKSVRLLNHDMYMMMGYTVRKRGHMKPRKKVVAEAYTNENHEIVSLAHIYPFIQTVVDKQGRVIARRKQITDQLRLTQAIEL
ncbi:hypothetical protein [Enterococcus sp. LJL90]